MATNSMKITSVEPSHTKETCQEKNVFPAQKLLSRPIQDTIPTHCRSFAKEWQKQGQEIETQAAKARQDVQMYSAFYHTLA